MNTEVIPFTWYLVLIVAALLLMALVWLLVRGLARLTTWIAGSELSVTSRRWIMVIIYGVTLIIFLFVGLVSFSESVPSARTKCSAFHRAITAGLEHYHSEFGEYPVSATTSVIVKLDGHDYDASGALMLYQALSGDGNDQIKTVSLAKSASDGKVNGYELTHAFLREMPRELIRKTEAGYLLVDGYGHPFQYTPGGAESVNENYDLWSFSEAAPTAPVTKSIKTSEAAARWIKNW